MLDTVSAFGSSTWAIRVIARAQMTDLPQVVGWP